MKERPSWKKYFMDMSEMASSRSSCLRRQVGAVIVKENRVLATGYNGMVAGITHCEDIGCLREKMKIPSGERQELCRAIHAEQNAIVQAAKFGIALDGATIYVNTQPCITCSKLIANVGIKKVIYKRPYPDKMALDILQEAGVVVEIYEGE